MPQGKNLSAHIHDVEAPSNIRWNSEIRFWLFISLAFLVSFVVSPNPEIARWLGFFFAAYAAVANDSIQTLGTFIAAKKKWYKWYVIIYKWYYE